ncbi:unnamed protein product [Adineta ricciae]|uniref:Uncharacterized protein n=1 Tax=Adineta ricciae TaxID=249248 RepID=A0A814VYT4_ADIRI|nr:unnamed protein product [Adineta ricciae]CAF1193835.1 unnamed protein product [Adineta ricciae]
MEGNPSSKSEPETPSLLALLKKYTTRNDERESLWKEGTLACRQEQKSQSEEIQRLQETVNKLQSKPSSAASITNSTIDYKAKWEQSEAKYRQLEKKYQELQNKTDQLQLDANQAKIIKEHIAEICSCQKLTNSQVEQLKSLVKNNVPVEPIASKNDFHQQTVHLRDILAEHNNKLLDQLEKMINKKRKRNVYDEDDDDDEDYE